MLLLPCFVVVCLAVCVGRGRLGGGVYIGRDGGLLVDYGWMSRGGGWASWCAGGGSGVRSIHLNPVIYLSTLCYLLYGFRQCEIFSAIMGHYGSVSPCRCLSGGSGLSLHSLLHHQPWNRWKKPSSGSCGCRWAFFDQRSGWTCHASLRSSLCHGEYAPVAAIDRFAYPCPSLAHTQTHAYTHTHKRI